MSNPDNFEDTGLGLDNPCAGVELIINPREKDLGGFSVRRLLPFARRRMVGPWIFFDHMGPAQFHPGTGIDVRPHPHINLATVTYLFEGEILHRDSLGSVQRIRPGAINLMLAGSGIVHSERESPEVRAVSHRLNGLQLWLALPETDEELPPAFYHYPASEIPAVEVDAVSVRVLMGKAYGVSSPVRTFAETLYLEAELQPDQVLRLPSIGERGLYVVNGRVEINGVDVSENSMAILKPGAEILVTSLDTTRVALIGGESPGHRYIDWNFVSSRKDRIEQAKRDWAARIFPTIPGDDQEFLPLP